MAKFTNTSTNMAQVVKNTIEGYRMGAVRALAQEPVQNAIDAGRTKKSLVRVTFRLHRRMVDGRETLMLTVTDSGTTGLDGPVLNEEQLERRGHKLKQEERWSAFEGQGYTKENEDALGSRGQGKAAFLYHSEVPGRQRRMLMFYDTLLADGKYRLGLRYARPVDQVLQPPLENDEARRRLCQDAYRVDDALVVPLGLEPLGEVGARIIVPFLGEEARRAFQNGELRAWLQRCWWRAIQTGRVQINLVDVDGEHKTVTVPSWWQFLDGEREVPFQPGGLRQPGSGISLRVWKKESLESQNGRFPGRINRLVLLYDENLREDEILDNPGQNPEYAGIQLLRGRQWIETLGAMAEFGDAIPKEQRAGFRGFVEFDREGDRLLREIENPQHESFDGRKHGIKRAIRTLLAGCVQEFAEEMGWGHQETGKKVSEREKQVLQRFTSIFLPHPPRRRKPNPDSREGGIDGLRWKCRLLLDYPQDGTTRVNAGQRLRNLRLKVACESPGALWPGKTDWKLLLIPPNGKRVTLQSGLVQPSSSSGEYEQSLGDWRVQEGHARLEKRQLHCPLAGKYFLRAVVRQDGRELTHDQRPLYVNVDPPPPPEKKPQTISITTYNESAPGQRIVRDGDRIRLTIRAKSYLPDPLAVRITARISEDMLVDGEALTLEGTSRGDEPQPGIIERTLCLTRPSSGRLWEIIRTIMLEPGRHTVHADLGNESGTEILDSARATIHFEREPGRAGNDLPFDLKQLGSDSTLPPMWQLDGDELAYPGDYPLWAELRIPQRQSSPLAGKSAFTAEIIAHGLLEWALRPLEGGDETNLDHLHQTLTASSAAHPDWERYGELLEDLKNRVQRENSSPLDYDQKKRETVAVMLGLFRKQN